MNIKKKNRLSEEKSPYLLQHAENPVDWYPWAAEAFDKAEKRDVPIFLSIGYSVCHWCHVMAHESFEDEEVASILNENFISIKIDREERPDIDAVYMSFCQAMTGSGGWPLTIIMTPDRKPFFAGTYLPKHSRYGSFGLIELLTAVKEKWTDDRSSLISQSEQVLAYIAKSSPAETDSPEDPEKLIHAATAYFRHTFDPVYGGFGHSPKFPSPHNLFFLLNQSSDDCTAMAEKTLIQMYRGGIFDHIAGGFSRYSTDAKWLVPHFEKMLYDNALLLFAYAQAEKITGKKLYRKIADKIAHYIAGELTHPGGGFYCGQDADSDGVEGKYYVFTPEEIDQVLGEDEGREFCLRYDITAEGNFEGKSIPNLLKTETFDEFSHEETLEKLSQYRSERTSLHKDDKILTGWNGLMIAALAYAARTLDRQDYMESARKAAAFVCNHLHLENGQLLKRWRKGQADFDGTLEDYAYFAWGLLECYSTTFDETYLKLAVMTGEQMLTQFFDEENGGCYLYARDSEQLILRPKETYDGALPSGNSVAALVMRKLAFFTGENIWQQAWNKQSAFLQREAAEHPAGQSFFLWQLTDELADRGQLICVSKAPAVHKELWKLNMDVLVKTEENATAIAEIAPFLNDYPIPESGASYYYCQEHTCRPPVDSWEKITEINR